MKEGDIALAQLPQADGATKPRPALVLRQMPPFGDWLVCGISTQLHQREPDFDEIITPTDTDFVTSGLKAPSLIRLGFLAVLPPGKFLGIMESVSPGRHQGLLQTLSDYLRSEN